MLAAEIFKNIYSDYGIRNRFYKKLRRKHIWRVKRHTRMPRVPVELLIEQRPEAINTRAEFGHWECDLMLFQQGVKTNLITLRERKTRYLVAIKNENKTAQGTALALISTIKGLKAFIRSITFDQGSEFQKYDWIRDCLKTQIYFCNPASPYQKGSVENGNGILRVEWPRNFEIGALKQRDINRFLREVNERPLKCLDDRIPAELFLECVRDEN